jgi:hypothetical protein
VLNGVLFFGKISHPRVRKKKTQEYFPIGTTIGMVSIFGHTSWSWYKVFFFKIIQSLVLVLGIF